jgi:potassium voltage-gated channel Eag-related subfamily H protein 8
MQLLNSNITTEEVLKAAKSLQNGKAGGPDGILNEMLKISFIYSTTAYVNLFNTILKSGIYPELWRGNYIKPIFKDGCFNDPSNYRGIALSSCFGKIFSKILSNRLDKFLIENDIIKRLLKIYKTNIQTF